MMPVEAVPPQVALKLGNASFEHISVPPEQSFLWRLDDYPWRRSVWNYHPEFEIHLIRHSSGLAYVGDYIGSFDPGQLVLVGSNLPHNWITPGIGDKTLVGRDIVVQFDPERLRRITRDLPELADLEVLFRRAALGIEFHGQTAVEGRRILQEMPKHRGLSALSSLLNLLALLAASKEHRTLATQKFLDRFQPGTIAEGARLDQALKYIHNTFLERPLLADVAALIGMSESVFCRFFKAKTGNTFSDYVRSLRIWTARKLLAESDAPITDICFRSGFNNISNFNRAFLRTTSLTPSVYRRAAKARSI
jgi:AraC-like DNA-binding protein